MLFLQVSQIVFVSQPLSAVVKLINKPIFNIAYIRNKPPMRIGSRLKHVGHWSKLNVLAVFVIYDRAGRTRYDVAEKRWVQTGRVGTYPCHLIATLASHLLRGDNRIPVQHGGQLISPETCLLPPQQQLNPAVSTQSLLHKLSLLLCLAPLFFQQLWLQSGLLDIAFVDQGLCPADVSSHSFHVLLVLGQQVLSQSIFFFNVVLKFIKKLSGIFSAHGLRVLLDVHSLDNCLIFLFETPERMLLCQLYSALFYLLNHSRAIVAHRTHKSFELIQSFVDDFCESREGDRAAELVGDESATGTVIEVADQR